jgi:hypothetical protein
MSSVHRNRSFIQLRERFESDWNGKFDYMGFSSPKIAQMNKILLGSIKKSSL